MWEMFWIKTLIFTLSVLLYWQSKRTTELEARVKKLEDKDVAV